MAGSLMWKCPRIPVADAANAVERIAAVDEIAAGVTEKEIKDRPPILESAEVNEERAISSKFLLIVY